MTVSKRLLERQLKSSGLQEGQVPSSAESWELFLSKVLKAYEESEQDRYLLERSLSISSREMQERYSALLLSETRKHAILGSSIDAIILFEESGQFIDFNPAAATLFGIGPGTTRNSIFSFLDLDLQSSTASLSMRQESLGRRSDGTEFPVEYVLTPVSVEDHFQYCVFIRDLTAHKEREKQITDQQLKLISMERLASLGQMAGSIAHEINNPLAIIALNVRLLRKASSKKDWGTGGVHEKLTEIDETLMRISQIITGLRSISNGKKDFTMTPVPVRMLLEEVIGLCREKFRNSNIDLQFDGEHERWDSVIHCDRVQLSQVLLNLLSNAFDAVVGLEAPKIVIDFKRCEGYDRIHIRNSGPVISEEISHKIFEPFYTTKDVGKGTGLGLSISRSIMERHRGSLDLDQESGLTTFIITLPHAPGAKV